ncbi:MAG: hypothetical protein H6704_04370 [Myxococcales bacterium]|nr:hypothetical protein [Myxococcales bacterium]
MERAPPPVWAEPAQYFAAMDEGGDPVERMLAACVGAIERGSADEPSVRRGPHTAEVAARFVAWGRRSIAAMEPASLHALRAVIAALQAVAPPEARLDALDIEAAARLELATWREAGGDPTIGDLMHAVLGARDAEAIRALRAARTPLEPAALEALGGLEGTQPRLSEALWAFAHDDLEFAALEKGRTTQARRRWAMLAWALVAFMALIEACQSRATKYW